jgi:hypothetical protein
VVLQIEHQIELSTLQGTRAQYKTGFVKVCFDMADMCGENKVASQEKIPNPSIQSRAPTMRMWKRLKVMCASVRTMRAFFEDVLKRWLRSSWASQVHVGARESLL